MKKVSDTKSRELFTLTVLVVVLGIAVGSTLLFGVSLALGAFLAGMIVGRSDFAVRAATDALPMRDAFAVLFFISVGMLFDPKYLLEAPGAVLATLAVVMIGKPLAAVAIVLLLRYPLRVAVAVAVALGQIGEFSFILAALGTQLKVLPQEATSALVVAAMVSISVNPLLYRLVDPVDRWVARRPRLARRLAALARKENARVAAEKAAADPQFRAVVVGYGPVGRTLVRLLRENGIEPTVIELNVETTRQLRAEGMSAVYGDANHPETLKAAGITRAGTLFLTSSGLTGAEEVVRVARELNPNLRVVARSAYLRERPGLRAAGADEVVSGEGEVALAMTESLLRVIGATDEQIDRERDRVRAELFGQTSTTAPPQADPPTDKPRDERRIAEEVVRANRISPALVRTPGTTCAAGRLVMRALAEGVGSFLGSVVCPQCRGHATARFAGGGARGDGWIMPAFQVGARSIACSHCGYSAKRSKEPGTRLAFELWFKTEYRGRLVWAYNLEHVRGIERFLASGGTLDEEPGHPASLSRLTGLPAWMYADRDGVRECLARLRDTCPDPGCDLPLQAAMV